MNKKNNDELTVNEIIVANLPDEIDTQNKLKKFRRIDKYFFKEGSDRYFLLRPYDREVIFITLFLNLNKISDVFKYLEKYIGKVQLIDDDFEEGFQGKIDFWVDNTCYSLVSADTFTVDMKRGI